MTSHRSVYDENSLKKTAPIFQSCDVLSAYRLAAVLRSGAFVLVCLAGSEHSAVTATAADQPNVLFIVSDDLNCRLGCYGDRQAATPHIDRLASIGTRFDRAYCQYPVCNPSRNSFLSGMRPNQTGLPEKWQALRDLVPDVTTLPQLFRQNGYYTASISKIFHISQWDPPFPTSGWPLGDERSWDFRINTQPTSRGPTGKPPFPRKGQRIEYPGHGGAIDYGMISMEDDWAQEDGQAVLEAIRVLDQPRQQPLFLAVGFRRPHAPFVAPEKYFWPYDRDTLVIPPSGDRSETTPLAFNVHPPHYGDPEAMRGLKQSYLASVSFLDAMIGRLIEALDHRDMLDDTIIVFFSDHGFALGERGNWHKFTLFEESARVPLIIHAPGKSQPGSVVRQNVELVDVYPTLMELCGLSEPTQMLDGESLVPWMKDPASAESQPAVTQIRRRRDEGESPAMGYSLRIDDYCYCEWWTEGETAERLAVELYDHRDDPQEQDNVADQPQYASIRSELADRLAPYRQSPRKNVSGTD